MQWRDRRRRFVDMQRISVMSKHDRRTRTIRSGVIVMIVAVGSVAAPRPVYAQQPRSLFIEELTSQETGAAIAAGYQTVLIFSGSIEASGPHLALGKHNYRARAYGERVARELGRTLIGPIVPFAPTSAAERRFPGTIHIRPEIYTEVTADIARSLAASGFKTIVLLGDHGANQEPLKTLAPRLTAELSPHGVQVLFSGDGYEKSTAEIDEYAKARQLVGLGHGGLWDTAGLWAVAPHAVLPDRIAPGKLTGTRMDENGVAGDGRPASPELGRVFGDIRVRNAVAEIRALLAPARKTQP
jgi:creatinine amidohydrolase/Fe(II)-dependent formamide hydrolase-like protein